MKKYELLINGEHFKLINEDNGRIESFGFYTTRYVEATSVKEAQLKAVELVKEEAIEYFIRDENASHVLSIEEIHELNSFGDALVPGKGFSLYLEKE